MEPLTTLTIIIAFGLTFMLYLFILNKDNDIIRSFFGFVLLIGIGTFIGVCTTISINDYNHLPNQVIIISLLFLVYGCIAVGIAIHRDETKPLIYKEDETFKE